MYVSKYYHVRARGSHRNHHHQPHYHSFLILNDHFTLVCEKLCREVPKRKNSEKVPRQCLFIQKGKTATAPSNFTEVKCLFPRLDRILFFSPFKINLEINGRYSAPPDTLISL